MNHSCFHVPADLQARSARVLCLIQPEFATIDSIVEANSTRLLAAFQRAKVCEAHFAPSTGYGYGDSGRAALEAVFADVFGTEAALVRHSFSCGTHTLATALFGVLRPGDSLLCVSGTPYDTLHSVIGLRAGGHGSLREFGVRYAQVDLDELGLPHLPAILEAVRKHKPKVVYLQRSRGYALRPALPVQTIAQIATAVKALHDCIVMVDNCYGEFVQTTEPTHHGADLLVGSLIKNPGGGLAPTGGYIAGRAALVELCAQRHSAPGVGGEVGATLGLNRSLFMGLFQAPHAVGEALKTAVFAAALLQDLGYAVAPLWNDPRADIVQSITLGTPEALVAFVRGIQSGSPVDSHLLPEPWDMPGYSNQIIMASGTFVMGASLELSCDAPLRAPYAAFLQGGLQFHMAKLAVLRAAAAL